ncbi:MAG: hypothetical protein AVDCRST_MAG90-2898 [uncultured Microvirga sp.]|uniref:Uncharacterized protein n=1 Tax=uncultured Microvirga sp. TaxID=412392 RepID=A0A6J4MGJ1_9HYPH|nr:MAG: hypothetical protein AVDCRST_MAG90-2898 [uncultured Microvirga sp.]
MSRGPTRQPGSEASRLAGRASFQIGIRQQSGSGRSARAGQALEERHERNPL